MHLANYFPNLFPTKVSLYMASGYQLMSPATINNRDEKFSSWNLSIMKTSWLCAATVSGWIVMHFEGKFNWMQKWLGLCVQFKDKCIIISMLVV